jgi:hypothetical protein
MSLFGDPINTKDRAGNYYTDTRQKFWNAGSDYGTEGVHKWCYPAGVTQPISFSSLLVWKADSPDNYGGNENCYLFFGSPFDVNPLKLADYDCGMPLPYICEVFWTVQLHV